MRQMDDLRRAFDLINQTVTACYDGNAGIRVLGPLLVAEQELRTELGPEAIKAYARAMTPEHTGARARPRFITVFDELERMCATAWAAAMPSITRFMTAVSRGDMDRAPGWAPGAAFAVAAAAGFVTLTSLALDPRDGAQASLPPAEKELASLAAPAAPAAHRARVRQVARAETVPDQAPGAAYVFTEAMEIQESEEVVVTPSAGPVWARVPNARRLAALYPYRALERAGEGEARLHCTVLDGGELDCARVEETSGSFGDAAMRVSRTLRHTRWRADGSSAVGTPVNLRVVFRQEEGRGRAV